MKYSLEYIANEATKMSDSIYKNIYFVMTFIAITLIIHIINTASKNKLNILGILPRKTKGLPGIILSPWIHGSFSHWFMNSLFFFVLASMMLMSFTREKFVIICLMITSMSGFLIWVFGRTARHIGASGVIMGLWGFLLVYSFRHPSFITIALTLIIFLFLGGMIANIIPTNKKVSWEGHLFGVIAGIASALLIY